MRNRWLVAGLAVVLSLTACARSGTDSDGAVPATSLTTLEPTVATTTSVASTLTTTSLIVPDGWVELAGPEGTRGLEVSAAASDGQTSVVSLCVSHLASRWTEPPTNTVLWSVDIRDWVPAVFPVDAGCITGIDATPFGFFAYGQQLFWSDDGRSWELWAPDPVANPHFQGLLGWTRRVFVSPDETRITVVSSIQENEHKHLGRLLTSIDGITWNEASSSDNELFDGAFIAGVTAGGDGLLAYGALPFGEIDPNGLVLTSADGLRWRRLDDPESPVLRGRMINSIIEHEGIYVAIGSSTDDSGAAWTSTDAVTWVRSELVGPAIISGGVVLEHLAYRDGGFLAYGYAWPSQTPLRLTSADGKRWVVTQITPEDLVVPFPIIASDSQIVGAWPMRSAPVPSPVRVFVAPDRD